MKTLLLEKSPCGSSGQRVRHLVNKPGAVLTVRVHPELAPGPSRKRADVLANTRS
jgi:hypothetical protein